MPLAGYQPETREIGLGGDRSFSVKGLSLESISVLIREHFPDLDAIVTLFQEAETMTVADFQRVALSVISQAPGLVANIIALAAGEGDASDAARLPGPVQLSALKEIGDLTFREVGGVGKAMETITGLLTSLRLSQKTNITKIKKAA